MTENRRFKGFTSSIDYYIVEDTLENRRLSKEDVINALNKFWIQYKHYEKENEQLKQRNNFLKEQLDRVCSENEIMGDKLKKIGRTL